MENTNIENVLERIISFLNEKEDWSNLEKIRYAYIELGKNIYKNVEFFYTLYGLMRDKGYSFSEIKEIYNNELPRQDVICRDAANMLKIIYDRIGIKSELKRFISKDHYILKDGEVDIQHYFLSVNDNEKNYFLTLTPDLPNIQLGLKTEHFATGINYINEQGNQVYEGEEIINEKLTEEDLKKIDSKIGYLSCSIDNSELDYLNVVLDLLATASRKNKNYLYKLAINPENDFYSGFIKVCKSEEEDSLSVNISKYNEHNWYDIKNYVCKAIMSKINDFIKPSYSMEELGEFSNLLYMNEYDEFIKKLNELLNVRIKDSVTDNMFTPKTLITNTVRLFKSLDKLKNKDYENINAVKAGFNTYVYNIAKVFTEEKYRPPVDNRNYTNEYITKKLELMFSDIFDFGYDTDFINMNSAEKGIIVDRIIHILFPELSYDEMKNRTYGDPIDNRIKLTVLYDKEEEVYKLIINIEANEFENNKVLIYDYNAGRNYLEGLDEDISLMDFVSRPDRYLLFTKDKLEISTEKNNSVLL